MHLHLGGDGLPGASEQLGFVVAQLVFGCADQVMRATEKALADGAGLIRIERRPGENPVTSIPAPAPSMTRVVCGPPALLAFSIAMIAVGVLALRKQRA